MPLIGGNKYSCEPCIRGHRATHCTHTDRILIEVRKPGRPLDRCAHSIKTCNCSKHLANTTAISVINVGVKQRSVSPIVGKEEGEEEVKFVMISKEMPFARELRLSPVGGRESDEDSTISTSASMKRKALPTTKETSSRMKKVVKRHRLDKSASPSPSTTSKSRTSMSVDVGRSHHGAMDMDLEPPALSPSVSESGSERSLPAYFERPVVQDFKKVATQTQMMPKVVFRGIAISDLLS